MKPTVLPLALILVLGAAALAAAAQIAPARPRKVKITAEQANLREKPDIGSSIVQQVPEGAVLEADKKEGEWYFVRYTLEDGGVIGGWIHESLVEVVEGGAPVPETEKKPATEAPQPAGTGGAKPAGSGPSSFPLEFSFSAGIGTLEPRDLNEGTRGFADWYGASVGVPPPGDSDILQAAFIAGFELSYRISPWLALGLGTDLLYAANRDEMVLSDPFLTETLSTQPSVREVPLKVTARFYPGAGVYIRAALGLYSVKAGYHFRHEGADSWEEWTGSATTTGIGGEAALGGEWGIAPKTAFFAEAGFRIARFEGLTGKDVYKNSDGEARTETGTLYFFKKVAADTRTYPLIFVRESVPAEEGVSDPRQAVINLSGTAVRAGIRYRF